MADKTSKAYAFFYCGASKVEIEKELPFIRKYVKTSNELELILMKEMDSLIDDSKLLQISREAKEANMRYVMEAKYLNNSNRKTADELASVLNQSYQSCLYKQGEQFRGKIFYKRREKYVSRI